MARIRRSVVRTKSAYASGGVKKPVTDQSLCFKYDVSVIRYEAHEKEIEKMVAVLHDLPAQQTPIDVCRIMIIYSHTNPERHQLNSLKAEIALRLRSKKSDVIEGILGVKEAEKIKREMTEEETDQIHYMYFFQ